MLCKIAFLILLFFISDEVKESASVTASTVQRISSELKESLAKQKSTEQELHSIKAKADLYLSTLNDVHEKVASFASVKVNSPNKHEENGTSFSGRRIKEEIPDQVEDRTDSV
ncbi:hypothetical protein J437_LFUL007218 [Ladona fulva]|uniref:Uncharacterized protein n=1 Tax=Ladona fulva TaxID=123851 RepID=A0A8K0P0D9_LADFU|nr:hypothetical protein J437_LFUL007218 [Ladona fulva]